MRRDPEMRDRILDAAQDLVQRVGANAMSYQHLSQALGITKPSIHYHFPSKADLLEEVVRRYSDRFLGVFDRILASEQSGREKLRRYCALFEATLGEGRGAKVCPCGMLGAEAATLDEATLLRLRDFYAENHRRLTAILEAGRLDDTLGFEGDPAAVAALAFSALEGGLIVSRVRGGAAGFRAAVAQLDLLLAG